ncbi:hypothetical protein [Caldimonas sp. KR1-144]|uniref:hypothetical protein n=1 Tax=Caldimonas sp. KR1-144 TaxID=3400911 RepID=UPI003BFC639A
MYLVAIAWLYVALMMAVAEATSPVGTVLGAAFTFLLYGLGPVALVMYLLGTPARRKRQRAAEAAASAASAAAPDGGGEPPAVAEDGAVAPKREEA